MPLPRRLAIPTISLALLGAPDFVAGARPASSNGGATSTPSATITASLSSSPRPCPNPQRPPFLPPSPGATRFPPAPFLTPPSGASCSRPAATPPTAPPRGKASVPPTGGRSRAISAGAAMHPPTPKISRRASSATSSTAISSTAPNPPRPLPRLPGRRAETFSQPALRARARISGLAAAVKFLPDGRRVAILWRDGRVDIVDPGAIRTALKPLGLAWWARVLQVPSVCQPDAR